MIPTQPKGLCKYHRQIKDFPKGRASKWMLSFFILLIFNTQYEHNFMPVHIIYYLVKKGGNDMSDEIQRRDRGDDFLGLLKSLEADVEEVIVVVKSGGSCNSGGQSQGRPFCCCKHTGILCNVTCKYIVLIGHHKKIFIPIDAIAAVIKKDCC